MSDPNLAGIIVYAPVINGELFYVTMMCLCLWATFSKDSDLKETQNPLNIRSFTVMPLTHISRQRNRCLS